MPGNSTLGKGVDRSGDENERMYFSVLSCILLANFITCKVQTYYLVDVVKTPKFGCKVRTFNMERGRRSAPPMSEQN
jgi:hypothetical protein